MIESTIILERSGLALRMAGRGDAEYTAHGFSLRLPSNGETRHAVCAPGQGRPFYSDRATCLAWLDARALELRAALLPPGTIVVADGPETRERIARALWDGEGYSEPWGESARSSHPVTYRCVLRDTDAVLAALRESRP